MSRQSGRQSLDKEKETEHEDQNERKSGILAGNHNQSGVPVKTRVKAGALSANHK